MYLDGHYIRWRANTKEGHKRIEKSANSTGGNKKDKGKALNLVDGELIISYGRDNKIFKRFKVSEEDNKLSFSIKF